MKSISSYFSVRYDLIQTVLPLTFDLYVNSSVVIGREKFVKIFSSGGILDELDLKNFHQKYLHLYVSEDQRSAYLKSLVKSQLDDVDKTNVIKEAALDYLGQIFDQNKEFSTELLAKNINACRDVVESMVDVLRDHNIDSLRRLIGNLSFHDFYTYDHSINVSMYCIQIYRALKPAASRKELMHIGLGGLLHDLGKIKIPTHILNRPERLSDEEYEVIKSHPDLGLGLLLGGLPDVSEDIELRLIARVIHEHHENFDGTGYPRRLKGKDEIHLNARICTIADFFDAVTTKRSYNEVLSLQDAMSMLGKCRGSKLDPDIFDVFDRQVRYVRSDYARNVSLSDSFDPTLPYAKLPLVEVKKEESKDFGKIKIIGSEKKKGIA